MANSSLHKPGVFSKLWRSVKPAATRFPALFVLGIVAAVAFTLTTTSTIFFGVGWLEKYNFIVRLAWPSIWGMLLSVLAQLIAERRFGRRVQIAAQAAIFALSLFALPPLFSLLSEVCCTTLLPGVPIALAAAIVFLLARAQEDLAVPNCLVSAVIAGIACLCAIAGLMAVFLAFTTLIVDFPDKQREVILWLLVFLPLIAVQSSIFIAFAARKREQISLPAAYRVIVLRILLPLGIALLAVLYAYLFKCLFTRTMPVGQINPFVSLATGFFLFFYFAALPYESPFLAFFRKYGAIFMLPLVAAQIAAFAIRIEAYGYTPARVASLLYIIFTVASCALTLVRSGKYMPAVFLIFAALCILGSATPLNIIDTANRSQVARITRVYRAHDLLADGVPVAEGAADALSAEEKRAVYESWHMLDRYAHEGMPKWTQGDGSDFKDTFGFATYEAKHGEEYANIHLMTYGKKEIDVSAFSHIRPVYTSDLDISEKGIVKIDEATFDLTKTLEPYFPLEKDITEYSSPLVIPASGGKTLIVTSLHITVPIHPASDDKVQCWIGGYLCW